MKSALIRPADDFWLYRRYVKRFGDPNLAKNKALGHVVGRSEGVRGVIVPGDDGEGSYVFLVPSDP